MHFRKDVNLADQTNGIQYFAAAPERDISSYLNINSGVLLINTKGMRETRDDFFDFIFTRKLKSSCNDPYDQGHLNDFYRGKINQLKPIYNWKPYWGYNPAAEIVHWHGCKYPAAKAIINNTHHLLSFKAHEKLFEMNPNGYKNYMDEYEELLDKIN